VIIICESESDLEFFADCEDSEVDDDDVISDEELTDAVSSFTFVFVYVFSTIMQRTHVSNAWSATQLLA